MKKLSSLLSLLILLPAMAFSTGMPVFDAQGLVYGILSYSEEATQVANFIKNMEREIRQYEQLYRKISEGDILGSINNIQGSVNRLEKNLDKYVGLGVISSSLFDISQATTDWLNHADDPDYFAELLAEVGELKESASAIMRNHEEDVQEAREEAASKANEKSSQVQAISSSDSEAEKSSATYNETVEGNVSQAEEASNSMVTDKGSIVISDITATERQITGMQYYAKQNVSEAEALSELEAELPDLDADMTPAYGR